MGPRSLRGDPDRFHIVVLRQRFRDPIELGLREARVERERECALEGVLRALNQDEPCTDVLQRLSAARGAINSLMAELMEDHIRHHMPRNSKSSEEAADDVIQIVRTYLK